MGNLFGWITNISNYFQNKIHYLFLFFSIFLKQQQTSFILFPEQKLSSLTLHLSSSFTSESRTEPPCLLSPLHYNVQLQLELCRMDALLSSPTALKTFPSQNSLTFCFSEHFDSVLGQLRFQPLRKAFPDFSTKKCACGLS